jgi:hypothetical protein
VRRGACSAGAYHVMIEMGHESPRTGAAFRPRRANGSVALGKKPSSHTIADFASLDNKLRYR